MRLPWAPPRRTLSQSGASVGTAIGRRPAQASAGGGGGGRGPPPPPAGPSRGGARRARRPPMPTIGCRSGGALGLQDLVEHERLVLDAVGAVVRECRVAVLVDRVLPEDRVAVLDLEEGVD